MSGVLAFLAGYRSHGLRRPPRTSAKSREKILGSLFPKIWLELCAGMIQLSQKVLLDGELRRI